MALVSLGHVDKHYGDIEILTGVTARIEPGQKIGIIGRNGAGKSTLLRLIEGRDEPTRGQVARRRELEISFLTQELDVPPETTVREDLERVFANDAKRLERLRWIEQRLTEQPDEREQAQLLSDYSRLEEELRGRGTLDVRQRVEQVLSGLGLNESDWDAPIGRFSGGERNLIGLARIVLAGSELVLLDEPSNHLDMDGLEWFLKWVRRSPQAIVMVSHDRHLLDEVVQEIWEVENGRLQVWAGNYSQYREAKEEKMALQERQWKVQQKMVERIEFQARRLLDMAKAYNDPGQARRAKAMMKRIERMDRIEKPREDTSHISARLDSGGRHGQIALRIQGLDVKRGDRLLLRGAELELRYGDRACLLGPNGCGKSSLFDEVRDRASPESKIVKLGSNVRLGEFRQFHEAALGREQSILEDLMESTRLKEREASDLLHRFLFSREDLERPVKSLSGGEKSRLQLARFVHAKVNFLMLDEPTNHLDLSSAEELEAMLADFDGTLFIISHDRWFLDGLVDQVVEIRDQRLLRFPGTVTEWWETRKREGRARGESGPLLESRAKAGTADQDPNASKEARLKEREEKKQKEREQRKLERRIEQIESAVEEQAKERARLETELVKIYEPGGDPAKGPGLQKKLVELRERVKALEAEWEDCTLALEALIAEDSA